jgi:NADPH:quinone reductase-like Zn-dependent oxidoreductase
LTGGHCRALPFLDTEDPVRLILDVPGNHSWSECKRALKPEGTYVLIGHDHFGKAGHRMMGSIPRFMKLVALSPFVSQLPKANFSMPPKKESMAS